MKTLAQITSLITLALMIVPSLLLCTGAVGLDAVKVTALVGTIGWFVATPIWMGHETTS